MTVMSELLHTDPAYYCGFDPTADSLHLGHMTVLSSLLNMAKEGYPVVALVRSPFLNCQSSLSNSYCYYSNHWPLYV